MGWPTWHKRVTRDRLDWSRPSMVIRSVAFPALLASRHCFGAFGAPGGEDEFEPELTLVTRRNVTRRANAPKSQVADFAAMHGLCLRTGAPCLPQQKRHRVRRGIQIDAAAAPQPFIIERVGAASVAAQGQNRPSIK